MTAGSAHVAWQPAEDRNPCFPSVHGQTRRRFGAPPRELRKGRYAGSALLNCNVPVCL